MGVGPVEHGADNPRPVGKPREGAAGPDYVSDGGEVLAGGGHRLAQGGEGRSNPPGVPGDGRLQAIGGEPLFPTGNNIYWERSPTFGRSRQCLKS